MPYTINNIPDIIEDIPKRAKEIWIKVFNEIYDETKKESEAIKLAWAAIKKAGYKKDKDGVWKRWDVK